MSDKQDEKEKLQSYHNSAERADDNKSSAYTLLFVGILGMAVVILGMTGVLPIRLSGVTRYMTYGVMCVIFILFIVMGIVSMKTYRSFARWAESESNIRDTIKKWCGENLTPEGIDQELVGLDELSEEEKYFRRAALMKEKVRDKFMNLDEGLLDRLVDEMYTEFYEQ